MGNPLGRGEIKGTSLETITKGKLLKNLFSVFNINDITVIADNAKQESIEYFKNIGIKNIHITNLGNLKGWRYLFTYITQESELNNEDIAYIVEDDYVHAPDGEKYIREGINLADYVSLYDSLDKYIDSDKGGNNPLISHGGELTRVIISQSIHWKYSCSTTGCFAAKIKTLRDDYPIFMKYAQDGFPHPYDFLMFRELITQNNKILITPIPGKSGHIGLELPPFVDWVSIINESNK
jgi:hypothetical protein